MSKFNWTSIIMMWLTTIAIGVLFAFVFAWFAALIWNYICPQLFGLPEITYWQMFLLILLLRMILPSATHTSSK